MNYEQMKQQLTENELNLNNLIDGCLSNPSELKSEEDLSILKQIKNIKFLISELVNQIKYLEEMEKK